MKKNLPLALAVALFTASLPLGGCADTPSYTKRDNVLRIASWDEYIDMGGEDSYYSADSLPIYEEFETWYKEQTGKSITVEYVPLQDNETMYNKIKMGDKYDLLCPSEYMAMKLKAENKLVPFPESFYDSSIKTNYYAQNESAYTRDTFIKDANLTGYMAGYMWGSTGFVFNPKEIGNSEEEARNIMSSWNCLSSPACARKITAKDNVRDSYFMGLGMYYENELLSLDKNAASYAATLAEKMNDTSEETMLGVKKLLENARKNLYGLETDEGKDDVIAGRLAASYQWSGDAVFILDEAEENGLSLEYSIPKSASNIWFDGWVMLQGANVDAATAFVNFVSRPDNAIRNMYYIGYTSCLAGEEIFEYVKETYSADEDETEIAEHDISYFFGDNHVIHTSIDQTRRQLFAQYPDGETKKRLVVMKYFDKKANERANRMWNNIK